MLHLQEGVLAQLSQVGFADHILDVQMVKFAVLLLAVKLPEDEQRTTEFWFAVNFGISQAEGVIPQGFTTDMDKLSFYLP